MAKTINLNKYRKAETAAKALYEHLVAQVYDGDHDQIEIVLLTPERSDSLGYGKVWRVMWESGPFEWMSCLSIGDLSCYQHPSYGVKYDPCDRETPWHMEPYYSFDVGFYQD